MKTVDDIIAEIIRREGGYVNDPDDPGGATKYGISLRYALTVEGYDLDLDHDGDVDKYDIQKLTPEIAAELYLKDFYLKPGYDHLPAEIQAQVTDIAVNAGPVRAGILLQTTINELGYRPPLHIDGVVGPKTCRAAEAIMARHGKKVFNNALVNRRIAFYERLVQQKPRLGKFLKGWKNRSKEFRL